jgi:hypothetical protein
MDRPGDVLDRLLSFVGEGEGELIADLLVHGARDPHASRLRQRLKPRRHVDAVAVDVVAVDNDVADVDPDPVVDPAVWGRSGIAPGHRTLDLNGRGDGVHGAGELDEDAVAGELDDATAIRRECGIDDLLAQGLDRAQRADFVRAHEPAVAGDVGGEDSRKPSFDALLAHGPLPSASGG